MQKIASGDLLRMKDYPWPGNIRELKHVIERAVLLSHGPVLKIPPLEVSAAYLEGGKPEKFLTLDEMEASHILKALSLCGGKVSGPGGAAALLNVKPTTLHSKMKRLGLQRTHFVKKGDSS